MSSDLSDASHPQPPVRRVSQRRGRRQEEGAAADGLAKAPEREEARPVQRGGSVPPVPPRWPSQTGFAAGPAECLPIPVPHGCHADPQAVFSDVVFDFTRLELQLRHFATQGCHDSQPHVPHSPGGSHLGVGEGPAGSPHQTPTQNPVRGGQECGTGKHLRNRLTSAFCDGETEVWVARIHFLTPPPPANALPPPHATHPL